MSRLRAPEAYSPDVRLTTSALNELGESNIGAIWTNRSGSASHASARTLDVKRPPIMGFFSAETTPSKVTPRKLNAIDRLSKLGQPSSLQTLEAPKDRKARHEPASDGSSQSSTGVPREGEDMFSIEGGKPHSSSPDPISVELASPTVVPHSEPRASSRCLAEPGSPNIRKRKERTTSPNPNTNRIHNSLPRKLIRPPKASDIGNIDASNPQPNSALGDAYQAAERQRLLKKIFNSDVWPFMDNMSKNKNTKFTHEALLSEGKIYANEILDKRLKTAAREGQSLLYLTYNNLVDARNSLHEMLCAKLREQTNLPTGITLTPRSPSPSRVAKSREEQNHADVERNTVRRRLKRGRPRIGRPKKYGGHELSRSASRSDLSLALPSKSQDEEIFDSIEVKSSLGTATSPTPSEAPYPPAYSFSTGDDPSSNTSPSSPFSETVILIPPASKQANPLQPSTRPSDTPRRRISIPIPPPTQPLRTNDIPAQFMASHVFIKSDTPASDGQPRRSQRPKGPDGLKVNSTETKPSQLRPRTTSALPRDPCYIPALRTHDFNSTLRTRELGFGKWYGPQIDVKGMNSVLGTHIARDLACWRSWTGASKDIITAAWAPNGCTYALGASTDMDNLNIQYNRPNNLLIGNNEANTLTELPDHFIERPRPETIETGENSLEGTYNSVDPELYTTVSHVSFGHVNDRLYSASFDKTVKIWDIAESGQATCVETLRHESNVELLALSHHSSNLLATCQRTLEASIRIYDLLDSKPWVALKTTLQSPRARKFKVYPTSLLLGTSPETSHLVLAGFSENSLEEKYDRDGDLCLWDVRTQSQFRLQPSSQAILDLAWHSSSPLFAAASAPGSRMDLTNRWTKSVIRTYTPLETASRIMEYECPAVDINEIHFHPFDDHYISAGCTDGITYVWDVRMPEDILHELRHDKPIDELDPTRPREDQDTGVRFTAWHKNGLDLYTGSSDGKIKVWNIFASPEDCHVRDVAQFDGAIMTGKFSPDSSNLLVGLSKGAVHILSTSPTTHNPDEEDCELDTDQPSKAYETIQYIRAKKPDDEVELTGPELADELLSSGQIVMHPIFGAGKGPYYEGPFAAYARPPGANPEMEDLDADILASQLDPIERKRGRRKGGQLDVEARVRYREANKIAEARNGPYRFMEGKRKPVKREIEYDTIRVEQRGEYDADTIRVEAGGEKTKGEPAKRSKPRGKGPGDIERGSTRGSKNGKRGHQYWEDHELIVIDEDN